MVFQNQSMFTGKNNDPNRTKHAAEVKNPLPDKFDSEAEHIYRFIQDFIR
jgi:hypothetical protein